MCFCFRKIRQIPTYVLRLVNQKSTKLTIPNMGFCTMFINVEITISRLIMENIISIKKPILFKNGISFRNLQHNSKYVFYMVHEQSTKLKIPNMGFCTLFRNVEIIISRLRMEIIISIKEPSLFKNGFSFRKLHHNPKYVFSMVNKQSTKLKISNMGFKYTSCKH